MDPLKAKANFARICQLLVDKGGDALRLVLHAKIPPSRLTTVLNAKRADLLKLTYPIKKPPVINDEQWELLYPTSGAPADAEKFDITLLTILLTNICALPPPVSGWHTTPPSAADTSVSADILRIKTFRNKVYGHIARAEYDDPTFETLWKEISKPLIKLGIPQRDIDELKSAYLSPEEKSYIEKLKEWKELEDVVLAKLRDVETKVGKVEGEVVSIRDEVVSVKDEVSSVKDKVDSVKDDVVSVKKQVVSAAEEVKRKVDSVKEEFVSVEDKVSCVKGKVDRIEKEFPSIKKEIVNVKDEVVRQRKMDAFLHLSNVDRLAKYHFTGKIKWLCELFLTGTRKWFFDKLLSWFSDENQKSRAMIVIAGPGVGKSVLSAKVCELYKKRNQLAAYHFCDYTNSDSANPNAILESLASQMCDNLNGFRDKLTEVLGRRHSRDSLSNAFRVLLQDPLDAFGSHEPMLIVLDALDESTTDDKSEFLELISDVFPLLPKWIKILISTRPELQVQKTLEHFKPLEICPGDEDHRSDLAKFIKHGLPGLNHYNVNLAIEKCQGSFLYAYYLVKELKEIDLGIEPDLNKYVPKGISGFYEKQFKRLQTGFQRFKKGVLKIFINVVAASKTPLPIEILLRCMNLSDENYELRKAISDNMSEIFPVYNDCLTVYHKSLQDWMILEGYEEHAFVADVQDGNERLWRVCETIYKHIDSLESVIDYSLSPEGKFALKNGLKYLEAVGELDNFYRFVNVNLNLLKLKLYDPWIDFISIPKNYSELSDILSLCIVQLKTVSTIIRRVCNDNGIKKTTTYESHETMPMSCYIYLQFLANGYFDFAKDIECKEEARKILNKTNGIWIEEVAKVCNSNFKIISSAFCVGKGNPDSVVLSPDKKLLVCTYFSRVQIFQLTSLRMTFELEVRGKDRCGKLKFSPDSSYCLFGTIRSCLRITKQKELEEVPFIPNGPENILSVSFSPCGNKIATFENKLITVWDVKKKDLIASFQIEKSYIAACLFSGCNQYIIATDNETFGVWDLATLKKLESASNNCVDSCLKPSSSFQIISPAISSWSSGLSIQAKHFHLPTGEIILVTDNYLSEPFIWKDRKCVVFLNSTSLLTVFDIISKEVVDVFQIDCLPIDARIHWVSHLDKMNFLVCFGECLIFLLSFERSEILHVSPYLNNTAIKCCSISPDSDYISCCFENRTLTVRSIDSGKALQSVHLEHPPEACWWSELYLWVVCRGVVFKCPYDSSNGKVLGNCVEECIMYFNRVLKFAEGILVIQCLRKISLFKACNEKLSPQKIPDSSFSLKNLDVVAVSSDGCSIVLLYKYSRNSFQCVLWENVSMDRWKLSSNIRLVDNYCSPRNFWLTGTSGSRCLEMIQHDPVSFCIINFSNKEERQIPCLNDFKTWPSFIRLGLDYLIVLVKEWIYFMNVSDGKIVARVYLGGRCKPLFWYYLGSRETLVFVEENNIKYFKIHNIENYLKSGHNTYSNNHGLSLTTDLDKYQQLKLSVVHQ